MHGSHAGQRSALGRDFEAERFALDLLRVIRLSEQEARWSPLEDLDAQGLETRLAWRGVFWSPR